MATINSTPLLVPSGSVSTVDNDTVAKAWVNFDGTTNSGGNCTINGSYNVSTVADEGSGDYTVNFTTDMANDDYAAAGMCSNSGYSPKVVEHSRAVGNIRVKVGPYSGSFVDADSVSVIITGSG
tara:strand:- start:151 stop:522 length:372 start_codon:yes stop_codon:yes gene_type:complete